MMFLDTDGDHKIDARELAAGQQMAAVVLTLSWDTSDRDADGTITLGELQTAAEEANQALLEADATDEQQAEDAIGKLLSLRVLLDRLAGEEQYADEIAALREAVEDLDDSDAVVTHLVTYAKRYPHLSPVVRTWRRYYDVRSDLRRHWRTLTPGNTVKSTPKPEVKAVKPGAKKHVGKPVKKTANPRRRSKR